ncbi:polysaccharide deacetylase family protein [Actinomadura algeriensis]|uniref:Peptidoglycan/xylan/chitin deacetylase (PgdA/CDA1 family) n=1 Tax=Actinomadura algeriensis TaxID=1679523 RepID=A0ABR9JK46_9ACTN|nr:polysaccharide deacetylase family protein [Actinomadura algeriensis]MBE1530933.1 peptidoglycan/xylan/chitin deacetylase (PgdA/CDA1 family) [Actinomadura algeriensis]
MADAPDGTDGTEEGAAEPAPWERTPPRKGRGFRGVTGFVFLCSLALATVTWVSISRPFDPGQAEAAAVRLDPAVARAAAALPAHPGSIVALTYHGVDDHDGAHGTLTRKRFGEHMAALDAAGYETVRLQDVLDLLQGRDVRLPPRALLLTFDDGRITDWTNADPVLEKHGFTAAAFLTTGRIVEPGTPSYHLSTRQVEDLARTGRWEFGSHTHALHDRVRIPGDVGAPLPNRIVADGRPETLGAWRARVRADLERSQEFFRRTLGRGTTAFSYPFGETSGNDRRAAAALPGLLRDAGFRVAFTGEGVPDGHVDAIGADAPPYAVDRIGVRRTTSAAGLLEMIRRAVPAPPPGALAALPWRGDGVTCERRGADLRVTGEKYGACVLGDDLNTARWRDYRVTASISGLTPRSGAVIAVRDGTGAGHPGRVEVVVGDGSVAARRQVGDRAPVPLGRVRLDGRDGGDGPRDVAIEVRGDRLTVRVEGGRPLHAALTGGTGPPIDRGGVRFGITARGGRTVTFHDPAFVQLPGR